MIYTDYVSLFYREIVVRLKSVSPLHLDSTGSKLVLELPTRRWAGTCKLH